MKSDDDNNTSMLRQLLKYCATWCLVLFFLLGGIGFNYVHYCCDECAAEGIEHVMSESCDAVHHHEHHQHTADCHHHNQCVYKRLAVSNTIVEHPAPLLSPKTISLLYNVTPIVQPVLYQPVVITVLHTYWDDWQEPDGKAISIQHCSWLL